MSARGLQTETGLCPSALGAPRPDTRPNRERPERPWGKEAQSGGQWGGGYVMTKRVYEYLDEIDDILIDLESVLLAIRKEVSE